MNLLTLLLLLSILALTTALRSGPMLRINDGVLQGTWQVSAKGRQYSSFEGVPYASPPIGKYRFREPQQLRPWMGIWDASKPLSNCIQYDPFADEITGSENCLFLNIHTPYPTRGVPVPIPVVVFIHGGAFMYGTGNIYSAKHLMDWNIVVVTLNYRLGPIGFLSTGDEASPGNFGLKDQAFALQWVKDNIASFGGDPDSVTLTGCSAGGASVHYHYLSPLSKGNFARGIAYSGSAFAPWTHSVKPLQKTKTLSSIVGCPIKNNREMIDCLRSRPAEVIVNAQKEMFDWKVKMFTPFTPTVEGPGVRNPFLSQYPYQAAQAGAMHRLPLITSVTSEEGLYPAAVYQSDPSILPELESNWELLAANIFEYNDTLPLELRAEVAQKIKQRYLGGRPVGQDTFPQLVQALGDRHFVSGVGKLAQIHAAKSGQPVYVYRYSFRGEKSLSNLMAHDDKNYGVSHADDLFHIFKYPGLEPTKPEDLKMTEDLINMLYSYAATGTPKITKDGEAWRPVQPGTQQVNFLEISAPGIAQMKTSSDFGQRTFWDSLGFIENEHYSVHVKDEL